MDLKDIINILSALLTPTIAILGLYIAYQQWKSNESKRRQELFDLRYENLFVKINELINLNNSLKEKTSNNIYEFDDEIATYRKHLEKYKFLIKEKDFFQIDHILSIMHTFEYDKNTDEATMHDLKFKLWEIRGIKFKRIYSILNSYLRIEKDNIIDKIINWCLYQKYDFYESFPFMFPTFCNFYLKLLSMVNKMKEKEISYTINQLLCTPIKKQDEKQRLKYADKVCDNHYEFSNLQWK